MHALVGMQSAFCLAVLFVSGLFVLTFERLVDQPTGFSADRILTLDTVARPAQSYAHWDQIAVHLREVPGVERVALAGWALMSGESAVGFISVGGQLPSEVFSDFLKVSPGWLQTMRIPLIDGNDFRPVDMYPGAVIVNQAFARQYFGGLDPVGKSFERVDSAGGRVRLEIVGYARDARSRDDLRLPIHPTVYVPFHELQAGGAAGPVGRGTFIVRTSGRNPLSLGPLLRREVSRALPGFRVSNVRTQLEINRSRNLREQVLAKLASFFSIVALLLAGVGLYGVIDCCFLRRRRELAVRAALGARTHHLARRVTADVFAMVLGGALGGLALGLASARYLGSLLYAVKPTSAGAMALPLLTILAVAILAALPPVVRALRIDPAAALRSD